MLRRLDETIMNILCWLLLIPVVITVWGLTTAAGWLLWETPGWPAMPLGNTATWMTMVCLAALVLLRRPRGLLRISALIALALAFAWGVIGYLMSGNWNFTFSGGDLGMIWWRLSLGLGVLLLANLCWTLLASLLRKDKPQR